jgi:hypothetical protein
MVVAIWPDNSISVVQCPKYFTMVDLFWKIDEEADPLDAKIYLINPEEGWSHATFDCEKCDEEELGGQIKEGVVYTKACSGKIDVNSGRRKRLHWPHNIHRLAYRSLRMSSPNRAFSADNRELRFMSSDEISQLPAEPVDTFSCQEINALPSFCGVYFAYDPDGSCHYVGESEDVPDRVRSRRPEIGTRKIGIIRCEPHDRRRIEAYFIAVLNPPGNGISTHRMKEKHATQASSEAIKSS